MVNEDILGGIELGVSKGEPIESVMKSFFNAGYHKEDIEWAAKAFQLNRFKIGTGEQAKSISGGKPMVNPGNPLKINSEGKVNSGGNVLQKPQGFSMFSKSTIKDPSAYYFGKKSPVQQNVSSYEQAAKFKERTVLIVLVFSLVLLIAALVGVFLFRDQLARIINSIFS
jgi:hypothetical protein